MEGLRGLLGERKASVRAEAIMGLGRIGPDAKAAIPELVGLLGDQDERIASEACVALGRIGEPPSSRCSPRLPSKKPSSARGQSRAWDPWPARMIASARLS